MMSGSEKQHRNPCRLLPKTVTDLFDGKSLISATSFTNVSCKLQFIFWISQCSILKSEKTHLLFSLVEAAEKYLMVNEVMLIMVLHLLNIQTQALCFGHLHPCLQGNVFLNISLDLVATGKFGWFSGYKYRKNRRNAASLGGKTTLFFFFIFIIRFLSHLKAFLLRGAI